ncbi:hypothetical protein [Streptomyces dubilierae]|uniref:Secreted protein n=1 Tax=Streptomyces dubilierae TaxID=3075533 RepID=A0ABU2P2Q9_9ACTN|nr:hypothetical protein [Streptomyces sp. DSM 41921]MDT0386176.1 hypothetical protein [Streptomyces sp. DSM 41921]
MLVLVLVLARGVGKADVVLVASAARQNLVRAKAEIGTRSYPKRTPRRWPRTNSSDRRFEDVSRRLA